MICIALLELLSIKVFNMVMEVALVRIQVEFLTVTVKEDLRYKVRYIIQAFILNTFLFM